MAFEPYLEAARRILERAAREEGPAIRAAAAIVAAALTRGGIVHAFGCGHSHLLAEEIFFRAGGLAAVNPILDRRLQFFDGVLASTHAEREPGYARRLLERESIRAGDAAVVISNSGRNITPIEMALDLQSRGVKVIALTSLSHAAAVASCHESGRRLHEIADVVIDTGVPAGDASIAVPGASARMGPLSTIAGAALLHAVMIEAAALVAQDGGDPAVLSSANVGETPETDLIRALAPYAGRVRYLDVPEDAR